METKTLSAWLRAHSVDARKAAAKKASTSVNYLYQIAGGHKTPRPKLAKRIEKATGVKAATLLGVGEA